MFLGLMMSWQTLGGWLSVSVKDFYEAGTDGEDERRVWSIGAPFLFMGAWRPSFFSCGDLEGSSALVSGQKNLVCVLIGAKS